MLYYTLSQGADIPDVGDVVQPTTPEALLVWISIQDVQEEMPNRHGPSLADPP